MLLLVLTSCPALAQVHTGQAPPPRPADTGRYLVGALMCPLWHGGDCWKPLQRFPDRQPLLGWYDEGRPEVADWETTWALDHGISFFMVCWYRQKDNIGRQPVRGFNEHWLKDALPKSRYGQHLRFAILWENVNDLASGVDSEDDLVHHLLPYWIDRFFRKPNYLLIDGKPVLGIFGPSRLAAQLGGDAKAAAAIRKMRAACRAAGFKDLILVGQYCWRTDVNPHPQMRQIGLDYSFAYHWPTFAGSDVMPPGLKPDPRKIIAAMEQCWRSEAKESLPNVVTVSMGWDAEPWGFPFTKVQWGLTPDEFQEVCRRAKALVDQRDPVALESRMILIDNWNEYGEGHYISPTRKYGFGHLNAIRRVFARLPDGRRQVDDLDTFPPSR
jgi:hypothetical protein